ncbi:uncharacterized protein N7482_000592 [Penicillium canariense]|uniref:Uncharacterized protein n=1 Tax=Penicillium canariense TaxID=189055 RepID=A0A9W9IEU8_9EURO|nr:uncharacterized protein N7482_000592 [Penicillium canariense]KAJ5174715.1 hypothetical protein N7482_000592 [Penicillium canariense]
MATEARFNLAKEEWLAAAKRARTTKESVTKDYEEQKEAGFFSNETFDQWVSKNAPGFINAWMEFNTKAAQYQSAVMSYDKEKAENWQHEYSRQWTEKFYGPGEDKGSQYIIITPEE